MPSERVPAALPASPAGSETERVATEGLDDVELALLAQLHFAAGDFRGGLDVVRHREGFARGLALIEARARFALGERDAALELVRALLAEQPAAVLARFHEAQFLSQGGRTSDAIASWRLLIDTAPDFPGALQSLAQLVFPGPPYREVLR